MRTRILLVLIAALVTAASASAHHSYTATYDTRNQVTLTGTLVQFVFKNPHSFVIVSAPDEKGAVQRWSLEWSGVGQLSNQGVKRETLKPGDQIVVVGNPSRVPGEYKALLVNLKRPSDGFTWGGRTGEAVD
jgi:Family of unknown function (DUF6152)